MGTKVEPILPGPECLHWNPPDETPISLYVMFWDLKKGDRYGAREPPNGHLFRLPQTPEWACDWRCVNLAFGWEVTFNLQSANMALSLRDANLRDNVYFGNTKAYPPIVEYELFTNYYQWPAGNWGWGGFAVLFWMIDIVAIAESLGLGDADDLLFEFFHVSPTEFVVKFCSRSLRTNVKLKFSV